MKWLFNLFKSKPIQDSEEDRRWVEGYRAFQTGRELYKKGERKEALEYLDRAIDLGITDKVFELRAMCLQDLEYHYDAIEDFDKIINSSTEDCNLYFMRANSKSVIKDFEGCISDLENAIQLSKTDNQLNKIYDDEMRKQGWSDGVRELFQFHLSMARQDLEWNEKNNKALENSAYPKTERVIKRRDK